MEREPIDWTPRAPRQRVSLTGVARWSDGTEATMLVSDITYQGCHLWSDREFACGETVTISLPGKGKIEGQVRWASAGKVGVRFLTGTSVVDDRRARLGV